MTSVLKILVSNILYTYIIFYVVVFQLKFTKYFFISSLVLQNHLYIKVHLFWKIVKMKFLLILYFGVAIFTTAYAFSGMIFTPKAGYKTNSEAINKDDDSTLKIKIKSQCWVRWHSYIQIFE